MGKEEIRISFDAENFKTLINGGVVEKENVKIILKDIGFDVMQKFLDDAKGYKEKINEEDISLVTYWIRDGDRRGEEMIKKLINGTFNKNDYLRG